MDRRHSLTHPFGSPVSRVAGIAMGLTLLWYGSSQISVAGLVAMLIGLIAAVSAAVPPQLRLQTPSGPDTPTADMPKPRVRSLPITPGSVYDAATLPASTSFSVVTRPLARGRQRALIAPNIR